MTTAIETLLPVFIAANAGKWIDLGDHRARPLVTSAHNGGAFLLCEVEVDFMGGVPPHIHSREDETFYILEGDFEMTIGGQTTSATKGDTAFGPRDVPHTWHCTTEGGGRLLIFVTPGQNFEQFALKMAGQKIVPLDPDCIAALCAIAEQHGLTMLPPQS